MAGARQLVSSGSPFEGIVGFSRAVRVGDLVVVSGTAPIGDDGKTVGAGDLYLQTRRCIAVAGRAVEKAGVEEHVPDRTREGIEVCQVDHDALTRRSSSSPARRPRSQVKARLNEVKRESYKECYDQACQIYDQSCQIEVGKEVAAQKTLAAQLIKLGSMCGITLVLYDLRTATTAGASTGKGNRSSTKWRSRWNGYVDEIVAFTKQPSYQTVGGGRPLIYLFGLEVLSARLGDSEGSHSQLSAAVSSLRQSATKQGLEDPFVVGKVGGDLSAVADIQRNKEYLAAGILDAVHPYHYRSGGDEKPPGQPYAGLWSAIAKNYLERTLTASLPVLPPLMSGANWAPREAHSPSKFKGRYWTEPNPAAHELEQHIWGGLDWITEHEASSPARSVLMYAWNEHSEGGFVCPLINPTDYNQPDTKRLDAVSRATKTWAHPQSRDRDGPVVALFSFGDREPSRAAITMVAAVTASEINIPAYATIVDGNNLRTARRGHSLALSSGQEVSFAVSASAPRRLSRVSLALRTENRATPCEVSFFLESPSGERTPIGSQIAAQSSKWQEISLGVPTESQAFSSSVKIAVRVLQPGAAAGRLYLDDLHVQSRATP